MKKILLSLAALLAAAVFATAGTVTTKGNTTAPIVNVTPTDDKGQATPYYYQDSEGAYPIRQGAKGGYYYKTAKAGKNAGQPTKRYLPAKDKETINNKQVK